MRVLVVAAHPDDEAYGVGGTIALHNDRGDEVYVCMLTEGCTAQYSDEGMIEVKRKESRLVSQALGIQLYYDLPDMRLDTLSHVEVNAPIEEAIERIQPDVVYTHHHGDVNKDHRIVYESTMVAARPGSGVQRVLSYEVASASGWGHPQEQFSPNVYVDISGSFGRKLEAIKAYESELREYPHTRSVEAMNARAKTRGSEANFEVAEAFTLIRERW